MRNKITFFIILFCGSLFAQVTKVDPARLVKPSGTANRMLITDGSSATAWGQASDLLTAGTGISISGNTISNTGVTGSGTANYLPKWATTTSLSNSILYETSSRIGVGTATPLSTLQIQGSGSSSSTSSLRVHNSTGSNFALYVRDDGAIGMGTSGPSAQVHINTLASAPNGLAFMVDGLSQMRTSGNWAGDQTFLNINSNPVHTSTGTMRGLLVDFIPTNDGVVTSSIHQIAVGGTIGGTTKGAYSGVNGFTTLYSPNISDFRGFTFQLNVRTPTGSPTINAFGSRIDVNRYDTNTDDAHNAYGLFGKVADFTSAGRWNYGYGISYNVEGARNGYGGVLTVNSTKGSSNNISTGVQVVNMATGAGVVVDAAYGLRADFSLSGGATMTAYNLVYCDITPVATTNYGLYFSVAGWRNWINGNLSLGSTNSNAAKLYVKGDGNTSSTSAFQVQNSSNNNAFYVRDDGNIGILTNSPTQNLDVNGGVRFRGAVYDGSNSAGTSGYVFGSTGSASQWLSPASIVTSGLGFIQNGNSFTANAVIGTNDAYGVSIETNNTQRAFFDTNGRFRLVPVASDPASPTTGDTWLNDTDDRAVHHFTSNTRRVRYTDDDTRPGVTVYREDFIKTNALPDFWLYNGDASTLSATGYNYGYGAFAVSTNQAGASANGFATLTQDADLLPETSVYTYTMSVLINLVNVPNTTNTGDIWIGIGGGNANSLSDPDDFVGFRVNPNDGSSSKFSYVIRKNGTSTSSSGGAIATGLRNLKIVWTNSNVAFYQDDVLLFTQSTMTNSPTGEAGMGMMFKAKSAASATYPIAAVIASAIMKIDNP